MRPHRGVKVLTLFPTALVLGTAVGACQGDPFVTETAESALPDSSGGATSAPGSASPTTTSVPAPASPTPSPSAPTTGAPLPPASDPVGTAIRPAPSDELADAGATQPGAAIDAGVGGQPASSSEAGIVDVTCTHAFAATPTPWPLPDPPVSSNWRGLERTTCSSSNVAFALLDLNADSRDDLVVLRDCANLLVGQSHWEVFYNEGAGFSTSPASFALPEAPEAYPYNALERKTCSAGSAGFAYATRDLDGNGIVDLVVVQDCAETAVGTTHWRVHLGYAGGFSATALNWSLPASPDAIPYNALERSTCGASNGTGFAYALADMDGDGALDMLVYDDCTDASVGLSHWNVYVGSAQGFGATALAFTLPAPPENHPFTVLERTSCDPVNAVGYSYSLREMTGDHKPDLLVYEDCSNPDVGTSHWLLFPSAEGGFEAAPRALSLPPSSQPFTEVERTSCSQSSATGFTHQLVDMNGDARADLVTALDCTDGTVGITHWDVYLADEAGFAAAAIAWPLPEPAPDQRWSTSEMAPCTELDRMFVLREMTGDGRPDLLVYGDCSSSLVGLSRWHVYENTCVPE